MPHGILLWIYRARRGRAFEKRGVRLTAYTIRKFLYHLAVCAAVYLLVAAFSQGGRVYAGWAAGALGACYLLAAWFSFLKSKGTDFLKLIRRKRPPNVPYYLRGPDKQLKPRLSLDGLRHEADDDLPEMAEERASEIPLAARLRLNALAWAAVSAAMLILSLF